MLRLGLWTQYCCIVVGEWNDKKGIVVGRRCQKEGKGPRDPLFGHAGTATAVEFFEGETGFQFHFGTDGSGYDAIITPDGGSRNQVSPESFQLEEVEGRSMHRLQTRMKGMDVFSFGISTAPKSVRKLAERFGFDYLDYDYFVFHQANMKMNNLISKKLKLEPEKVPSSMYSFGNTSSASIPLTIVTQLKQNARMGRNSCVVDSGWDCLGERLRSPRIGCISPTWWKWMILAVMTNGCNIQSFFFRE